MWGLMHVWTKNKNIKRIFESTHERHKRDHINLFINMFEIMRMCSMCCPRQMSRNLSQKVSMS